MSPPSGRRPSYVLTYEPPKFSLSAGTAFEVPAEELERLPLEPFPAVQDELTSDEEKDGEQQQQQKKKPTPASSSSAAEMSSRTRADSARHNPLSPGSSSSRHHAHEDADDKPRKLFSLRSLRKSFSSSRGSLNLPRASQDTLATTSSRPQSPGFSIASSSAAPASSQPQQPQQPSQSQSQPRSLRNKRSSTWFGGRRSGFANAHDDGGMLDAVAEDPAAGSENPRESKRVKDKDVPELPAIPALGGEHSHEIGWDEQMFKN
jgi:hypothetical protein